MRKIDKVKEILFKLCGACDISLQNKLKEDLALDSLQMVTLLLMIEEKFQITLDESDMNPFELITVNDILLLVKKYVRRINNEKEN